MTAPALALVPDSTRLPDDPAEWTYQQAADVVRAMTPDWMKTTKQFVDGDHWQSGAAWIGPQLAPSEPGQSEVLRLLHAGFTSRNVVKELAERHTNGLCGFEPSWELTLKRPLKDEEKPTAAEQTLMDEAHAALTEWWDRRGLTVQFWNAAFQLAWASRSPIRLYLTPRAFRTVAGSNGPGREIVPEQESLENALRLILVDVPEPSMSAVYVYPATQEEVGVRLIERNQQKIAELTYRNADGATVVRTINGSGPSTAPSKPMPLDDHLTMHEMKRLRLVTDQALQLQRALNLALSVIPRTITTAGFLERILINASLPGEWVEVNGKKKWKPDPITMGPATTITLQGETHTDPATGRTSRDTPEVVFREPVAVTGTIEAREALYAAMLEEVAQAHVLLTAEATPSGRSREQARADFKASLGLSKHAIDRAGRWLIGAALALAEVLANQRGRYTDVLRVRFNSRLDTGPLSTEERAQNVSEWKEGLLSKDSVLTRGGVEDPDAEIATIMSEPGAQLAMATRQAETFAAWQDIGVGPEVAAGFAKLDDEAAKAVTRDLDALPPEPGPQKPAPTS